MQKGTRGNILGDLMAEGDHAMLESAFLETADYKTLIDTTDRPIVIGRRGTGKSALAYRLTKHWRNVSKADTLLLAPTEEQVLSLRGVVPDYFSPSYKMIRAGTRVAWRYALLAEAAVRLTKHYKFDRSDDADTIRLHALSWSRLGMDVSTRLRRKLREVSLNLDASGLIGEIATRLGVSQLQDAIDRTTKTLKHQVFLLIDKVDEGYEPDEIGVAMVDGLVLAAADLNSRLENGRVVLFLRDNMARALEQLDPDYSRDIEGQVLRLHWEESQLFSLVCNRLRLAFGIEAESDVKVWNRCAARELEGREGFKKCLRLTLYRPRDILALLNDAFLVAKRDNDRSTIIEADVEATASHISRIRLEDLHKEYSAILPGINHYTATFKETAAADMPLADAYRLVEGGMGTSLHGDEAAAQTFELLKTPSDIGAALYSIGFLGVKDQGGVVTFCHDGRMLDRALTATDRVMVHPCYWMALGIKHVELEGRAEEIFDDYDIRVVTQRPELRKAKLGQLIGRLDRMKTGDEAAGEFEQWCLDAIQVIFSVQLTNIALHPNRVAIQRRDIVATNLGRSELWRRVLDDYKVRQVIFEIKNFADLGPEEYRQMASYLGGEYGSLGFIISRDDTESLLSDRELPWMREFYNRNRLLIVKLTGKFVQRILSKLRSPQRHDEADSQLNKLLDVYIRNYLGEQVRPKGARKKDKSKITAETDPQLGA